MTMRAMVKRYHSDNGIFRANKWQEYFHTHGHVMTFAAVGAHHQNGRAEAQIRVLYDLKRSMMLDATAR